LDGHAVIDCETADAQAGAFALRALAREDLRAMEAHLAGCEAHSQVAQMERSVVAIALATQEMEPGTHLRTRIVEAALRGEAPAVVPARKQRRRLFRGFSWQRLVPYGVAAGAGLVIGLVVGAAVFG
jgi:hypothetical protein